VSHASSITDTALLITDIRVQTSPPICSTQLCRKNAPGTRSPERDFSNPTLVLYAKHRLLIVESGRIVRLRTPLRLQQGDAIGFHSRGPPVLSAEEPTGTG
jgi:hypothetical protein